MLAKLSIELQGFQAALLLFSLLVLGVGLYLALRRMERSRDRFTQLLEAEQIAGDGEIPGEWETEYTNPVLLGVSQVCVRFKVIDTDDALYLWKHRSLTGGTRTGIVLLTHARYAITRELGHLNIQKKKETEQVGAGDAEEAV